MSIASPALSAKLRRLRPAGLRCRGGASSLLRLSNPATSRLPSNAALASWVSRASQAMSPHPMVAPSDDAAPELITRLLPSPDLARRVVMAR